MGRDRALDVAIVHRALGSVEAAALAPTCSSLLELFRAASSTSSVALSQPPFGGSAAQLANFSQGMFGVFIQSRARISCFVG